MIDIHSHILPEVDDGAKSLDEALRMAEIAVADGITHMVATPHCGEYGTTEGWESIKMRVSDFQAHLDRNGIGLQMVTGTETLVAPTLPQWMDEEIGFSIGKTRYLLIEFPFTNLPFYTENVLFDLQAKGFTPIVAHPERYAYVQQEPEFVEKLVSKGMLMQVTAGSLTGVFGERARASAEALLKRNLVHFLASDAHSPTSKRIPVLTEGLERAIQLVGEPAALQMVVDRPRQVLADEDILIPEPVRPAKKPAWAFWR
jgi:protein-tyrosine phosphatase